MSGCCTKFVYVKWIGKNVEKKYSKCNCDHGNHGDCVRRTVIKVNKSLFLVFVRVRRVYRGLFEITHRNIKTLSI